MVLVPWEPDVKKMVLDRYGPPEVLRLEDVEVPELGDHDVLVRMQAAAINPADWHVMVGLPHFIRAVYGLRRPRVSGVGSDLAGEVAAVGPSVTDLRVGDEVFGHVGGLSRGALDLGSIAEYVPVAAGCLRRRPPGVSAEEAAGVPLAGTTALWAMDEVGGVQPGMRVLVNGASGGVGTFAVQVAKARGAEVVGVCSTRNVALVVSLGADHVVDYTTHDVTAGPTRFDLVLDNVGNHTPAQWQRVVAPGGRYLASFDHPDRRWGGPLRYVAGMAIRWSVAPQRMTVLQTHHRPQDLDALAAMLASGELRTVVDRTYPMADTVAAFDYLATRRARGKVVVTP